MAHEQIVGRRQIRRVTPTLIEHQALEARIEAIEAHSPGGESFAEVEQGLAAVAERLNDLDEAISSALTIRDQVLSDLVNAVFPDPDPDPDQLEAQLAAEQDAVYEAEALDQLHAQLAAEQDAVYEADALEEARREAELEEARWESEGGRPMEGPDAH